ncbi:hypothetical protein D3C75_585420 [compost metagenome]
MLQCFPALPVLMIGKAYISKFNAIALWRLWGRCLRYRPAGQQIIHPPHPFTDIPGAGGQHQQLVQRTGYTRRHHQEEQKQQSNGL